MLLTFFQMSELKFIIGLGDVWKSKLQCHPSQPVWMGSFTFLDILSAMNDIQTVNLPTGILMSVGTWQ